MEPLISIVVPTFFRNPQDHRIPALFHRFLAQFSLQKDTHFQIFISDSGPVQHQTEIHTILNACLEHFSWMRERVVYQYTVTEGPPLSRAEAMNVGVQHTEGEYILFLHIDCQLPDGGLFKMRQAFSEGARGGGFLKRYVGKEKLSPLLLTEQYLNWLRTWKGRHLVGTNGIYLHRSLAQEHPYTGIFLEDVELSDWMRVRLKGRQWQLIHDPMRVSAQKYQKLGVWRSIAINFSVMALYRIFDLPPEPLKTQLYHRAFSSNHHFWKEWLTTVFSLLTTTHD